MNRRRFLGVLAGALAGAALDPERALWVPGAKTHILPPPQGWRPTANLQVGDLFTIQGAGAYVVTDVVSSDLVLTYEALEIDEGLRRRYAPEIDAAVKRMAEHIDREILRLYNTSLPSITVLPGQLAEFHYPPATEAAVMQLRQQRDTLIRRAVDSMARRPAVYNKA